MAELRGRALLAGLALTAGALAAFACGSDDSPAPLRSGDASTPNPEPLFRALQDDLVNTCGGQDGACHVSGSYQHAPTWLGGPDPYVTIKKYKGVLPATKEVGDSILLTQVHHEGPALTEAPNELFRRVSEWVTAEVPGPPLPNTGGFSVATGFNSVPLDTIATGLKDARLTFLATENNGTLTLSALRLTAPTTANVKVDSPFFVILPRSGKVKADPDSNGFKGTLDVPAGQTVDFFGGKMILLGWDPTGRLKVAFDQITTTPGTATTVGCSAVDVFSSSALPAMGLPVDVRPDDKDGGPVDGQSSCLGCHAETPPEGEAPSPAVRAMDLRAANTNAAAACAQAKLWINLTSKADSTILLNPTGKGNPIHPMVPVSESDPIVTGIKTWVDAEH